MIAFLAGIRVLDTRWMGQTAATYPDASTCGAGLTTTDQGRIDMADAFIINRHDEPQVIHARVVKTREDGAWKADDGNWYTPGKLTLDGNIVGLIGTFIFSGSVWIDRNDVADAQVFGWRLEQDDGGAIVTVRRA